MIVELAGLPGSGKTTLLPIVRSACEANGRRVLNRRELEEKLACSGKFGFLGRLLFYFRVFLRTWITFNLSPFNKNDRSNFHFFYWLQKDLLLASGFRQKFSEEFVYLVDEGIVQHTITCLVFGQCRGESLARAVMRDIGALKLEVLSCKIDLEQCFQRMIKRGVPESWESKIGKGEDARVIFTRFKAKLDEILTALKENGVEVQEILTGSDLDVAAVSKLVVGLVVE